MKKGKKYTYQDLVFWAEEGMVRIVDGRDGSYKSVDPVEWQDRANAVGEESKHTPHPDERRAKEAVANTMTKVAEEAVRQGNPMDPKVREYRAKHRGRNWSQGASAGENRSRGGIILGR